MTITISTTHAIKRGSQISGILLSLLLVASCASSPVSPEGSAQARNDPNALQNDANLASQARVEIREAEEAVSVAEEPLSEDDAERKVQIEGYTDNVGSEALNRQLSRQRAESVSSYLTQQSIASHRVSAMGLSMGSPIASNDTAAGWIRQRIGPRPTRPPGEPSRHALEAALFGV